MSARYVRSLGPKRHGMAPAQMNDEILLPGAQNFLDALQHQFTSQLRKVSGTVSRRKALVDVGGAQLLVERFQGNLSYSSCFCGSKNGEDAVAEPKVVLFEAEKRAVIGEGK